MRSIRKCNKNLVVSPSCQFRAKKPSFPNLQNSVSVYEIGSKTLEKHQNRIFVAETQSTHSRESF